MNGLLFLQQFMDCHLLSSISYKGFFILILPKYDLAKIELCLVTDDKGISQNRSETIQGSRNDPSQVLEHFGLGAMELVLLELTTSF